MTEESKEEPEVDVPNLKLEDISDGMNERNIPSAKFIDDVQSFAFSFTPMASAELLIGAYTDLHSKYKLKEAALAQKRKPRVLLAGIDRRVFVMKTIAGLVNHLYLQPTY
jgi:hypothetical protein